MYGFEEPFADRAETAPEPAAEDIAMLLAEQPEVARFADFNLIAVEEPLSPLSDAVAELPPKPQSAPPRVAALLPEPQPSPPPVLVARLSHRVVPPPAFRKVPEPAWPVAAEPAPPPPIPEPCHPVAPPPPAATEPPQPAPPPVPAPTMDRVGRQVLSRNRRLYRRVHLGAEIEINGELCSLIDISIGGFAATGIADVVANTTVPVILRLTIDGIEVGTRLNARIVYANRERLSGRFIDLTASQTAFLRYIVTWRGKSVGTVGTTTLLDAITGGADHGFAPKSANGPRERWWAGLIGWKINPPR